MSIFKKNENNDLEDYDNMASGDLTPDLKFENKELEQKFSEVLATLPQKQRETFALRYFEELSYNEISDMLGTSVGGLKANYHQAVTKLAEYLKPVFYPEGSEE
jgi:RNA polymerase sigma-70 factor (ECF subfamily)